MQKDDSPMQEDNSQIQEDNSSIPPPCEPTCRHARINIDTDSPLTFKLLHRNSSNVRQKNVLNYLNSKTNNLIIENNLIIKTLKVEILSSSWNKVDQQIKEIKNVGYSICKCHLLWIFATDFSNSTYKKNGITKRSQDYGLPYINLMVIFKNSSKNEQDWETFVKEFNEKNKYTAAKEYFKKDASNEKIVGFTLKNHDNKYLLEKLKRNPIEIIYFNIQEKTDHSIQSEKIIPFFKGLEDLGIKFTTVYLTSELTSDISHIAVNSKSTCVTSEKESILSENIEEYLLFDSEEKLSRPEDSPFIKFVFELADHMRQKEHKIYVPKEMILEKIVKSKYSYQKETVSSGDFVKYLDKYVTELFKTTRDNKVFQYKEMMLKDSKCYFNLLPIVEYYDYIEFKNCIYSINDHSYWKKEIISNLSEKDETIQSKIKELSKNFACLRYFDKNIDLESKPIIFEQILDNSFSPAEKQRFIEEYSKLFHPKQKRETGIHVHGDSQSGKTTLFEPFMKLYGEEKIGMIAQSSGAFDTSFLTKDVTRVESHAVLEGSTIIRNAKWKNQEQVLCDKNTVISSNEKISFGAIKVKDGIEYDPNAAINTRLETFKMKKLNCPDKKYITKIEEEIPQIVILCNDIYFERKAKKKRLFPIDSHPEIISLLQEKEKEEIKKRKRLQKEDIIEENWEEDQEDIPIKKKVRLSQSPQTNSEKDVQTSNDDEKEILFRTNASTSINSKNEEKCRSIFEKYFKKEFPSIRHPDIINPKTGELLELDGYNEELKIAFEYNGYQHYVFPNKYHKSQKDYDDQRERDQFKNQRCFELGIHLIVIPYTEDEHLEDFITSQIDE